MFPTSAFFLNPWHCARIAAPQVKRIGMCLQPEPRERRSWTPTGADGPKTESEKPGTPSTGKCDLPDGWASSRSIAT